MESHVEKKSDFVKMPALDKKTGKVVWLGEIKM